MHPLLTNWINPLYFVVLFFVWFHPNNATMYRRDKVALFFLGWLIIGFILALTLCVATFIELFMQQGILPWILAFGCFLVATLLLICSAKNLLGGGLTYSVGPSPNNTAATTVEDNG